MNALYLLDTFFLTSIFLIRLGNALGYISFLVLLQLDRCLIGR